MKIRIRLYGELSPRMDGGEGIIEVPEGTTVSEIPSILDIDQAKIAMIFVGHDRASGEHALEDGDSLKVIPPVSGG
jgi:molybdopterin synthase sulfur carrier subunit